MRKYLLLLCFLFCFWNWVGAQGIHFENGTYQEVLAKAKKTGKYVFVDCYTVWCGPCRLMSQEVFTDPKVGDYFNAKFLNFKMDMEKGDGLAVLKRYQVNGFPTFLFLDGDGNLVHRSMGRMSVDDFIATAREVFNEQSVLRQALVFKQHIHDSVFVKSYLNHLEKATMYEELWMAANEYLEAMPPELYLDPYHWELIRKYVLDYQSPVMRYLLAHYQDFYAAFGKNEVTNCVASVYRRFYVTQPALEKVDIQGLDRFIDGLRNLRMGFVPSLLGRVSLLKYSALKDIPQLVKTMNDCFMYGFFNADMDSRDDSGILLGELGTYCKYITSGGRKEYNADINRWFTGLMGMVDEPEYKYNCIATLYDIIQLSGDQKLLAEISAQKDQLGKLLVR